LAGQLERPPKDILEDKCPKISDMSEAINRWSTAVESKRVSIAGLQFKGLSGQGIE
jgi:hypothetical protein